MERFIGSLRGLAFVATRDSGRGWWAELVRGRSRCAGGGMIWVHGDGHFAPPSSPDHPMSLPFFWVLDLMLISSRQSFAEKRSNAGRVFVSHHKGPRKISIHNVNIRQLPEQT